MKTIIKAIAVAGVALSVTVGSVLAQAPSGASSAQFTEYNWWTNSAIWIHETNSTLPVMASNLFATSNLFGITLTGGGTNVTGYATNISWGTNINSVLNLQSGRSLGMGLVLPCVMSNVLGGTNVWYFDQSADNIVFGNAFTVQSTLPKVYGAGLTNTLITNVIVTNIVDAMVGNFQWLRLTAMTNFISMPVTNITASSGGGGSNIIYLAQPFWSRFRFGTH